MKETKEIKLTKVADLEKRIQILTLLFNKAEAKVTHADTFRQRNMNYALAVFAGLIAIRLKLQGIGAQYILSVTLLILSGIFCIWDRKWHKTKHGWDSTSRNCYEKLVTLVNNPDQDVLFLRYDSAGEHTTEWTSWQPIVFYFLVLGSIASFFIS